MNLHLESKTVIRRLTSHYPLPTATICYVAGISGAYWYTSTKLGDLSSSLPLFIAAGTALLSYLKKTPALLMVFFALLGLSHGALHLQPPRSPGHIYNFVPRRTTLTISGTLHEMPSEVDGYTKFTLNTDGVASSVPLSNRPIYQRAHGLVTLTLAGQLDPGIAVGQRLLVRASLDRITSYKTPGVFDYRVHMASQGLYVSGFISSPTAVFTASPISPKILPSLQYMPERIRFKISQFINENCSDEHAGVYRSLLIGDRARISPDLSELFINAGCMHILAISGLHMSLLALVIISASRWLLKRSTFLTHSFHIPTISSLSALPPLLIYCYIAGMNTPALRAFLMATLAIAALAFRRQRAPLHYVSAAVLILTSLNPLLVYTVSFQLSVVAILGIILILPRLTTLYQSQPDDQEPGFSQRIFRLVKAGLFISTAATVSTLPFVLHHFNRFSLIGPVANLIVEPLLCFWTLPWGLLSSIFIPISQSLAQIFLKIGGWGITATLSFLTLALKIPFATIRTITPSPTEWFLYFLIVTLTLNHKKTTYQRAGIFALTAILLASPIMGFSRPSTRGKLEVDFLDIGQGSSTLIKTPRGHIVLVDGGGYASMNFDPGERIIASFLYSERIRRIDDIIITHPHADHYNGIPHIIKNFTPKRLWIVGNHIPPGEYQDMLTLARQQKTTILPVDDAEVVHREKNLDIRCKSINYHNNDLPEKDVNEQGLLVTLRYGATNVLLPGDIGVYAEQHLVKQHEIKHVNLLLAPHHGSKNSCLPEFIELLSPQLIVVSAGKNKQGIYPATKHMLYWQSLGIPWLVTSEYGTLRCFSDGKSFSVTPFGSSIKFTLDPVGR